MAQGSAEEDMRMRNIRRAPNDSAAYFFGLAKATEVDSYNFV